MDLGTLSDLSTPWCIHVAATLRIADHIEVGAADIDSLAAAAGVDRDSLHRVLRHLVSRGVFEEPERGRFALNETARGLLGESDRLGFDLEGIGGRMAYAWGTLLSAVRTGKPAYHEAFGRGTLVDLPRPIARSAETFEAAGVADGATVPWRRIILHMAGDTTGAPQCGQKTCVNAARQVRRVCFRCRR